MERKPHPTFMVVTCNTVRACSMGDYHRAHTRRATIRHTNLASPCPPRATHTRTTHTHGTQTTRQRPGPPTRQRSMATHRHPRTSARPGSRQAMRHLRTANQLDRTQPTSRRRTQHRPHQALVHPSTPTPRPKQLHMRAPSMQPRKGRAPKCYAEHRKPITPLGKTLTAIATALAFSPPLAALFAIRGPLRQTHRPGTIPETTEGRANPH